MVTPAPSSQLASLRPDIKEALHEFNLQLNLNRMIALQVFPVLDVNEQGGSFPKLKIESMLKLVDTSRASGGGYAFSEYDFTDDTFATKENGVTVPIDRRNKAIYSHFQMDLAAGVFARNIVVTNLERRVAAKVFNTDAFTPEEAEAPWTEFEDSMPINDVELALQRLYDKGVAGNALICSWKSFRNLRQSAQIIDRVTANGAGSAAKPDDITLKMLAQALGIEKVLVGGAQYNPAKEGQPAVLSPIWSNSLAAVVRVAAAGSTIEDAAVGRTLHWSGDGSTIDGTIETYYDEDIRGDKLRYRMETQEKVLYDQAVELLDIAA